MRRWLVAGGVAVVVSAFGFVYAVGWLVEQMQRAEATDEARRMGWAG